MRDLVRMRHLLMLALALGVISCGMSGEVRSLAPDIDGTIVVTLDAELTDLSSAPMGGIEFAIRFTSDEVFNIVPDEHVLDPSEPLEIARPAVAWTAEAAAWKLSDVVDADGSRSRMGRAFDTCSIDFNLAPSETIELLVKVRDQACTIAP